MYAHIHFLLSAPKRRGNLGMGFPKYKGVRLVKPLVSLCRCIWSNGFESCLPHHHRSLTYWNKDTAAADGTEEGKDPVYITMRKCIA